MKRALGSFVLFAFVAVAAGCGGNSTPPPSDKKGPPPPPPGPSNPKGKTTTPVAPKGMD